MKPLLIILAFASLASAGAVMMSKKVRKPVGCCEPYAEVCRHCTDCSQCRHCSKDRGKCSVCWTH
jgi:hypothetical protein